MTLNITTTNVHVRDNDPRIIQPISLKIHLLEYKMHGMFIETPISYVNMVFIAYLLPIDDNHDLANKISKMLSILTN